MAAVTIKIVPHTDPELRRLIQRLDTELLQRYPADSIFSLNLNSSIVEKVTFVVAETDDLTVGCGAILPIDDQTVELRRFYVEPSMRGQGIASAILRFLEDLARQRGYRHIVLETGPKQPGAIGLYHKFGYRQIPSYGEYEGCEYSLCMAKDLRE